MFLTAYDFQASFDAFELARFCQKEEVDTLLMNIAWLRSDQENGEEGLQLSKEELMKNAQLDHINYLVLRLLPLIKNQDEHPQKPLRFIACNRVGKEAGSEFAGTSFGIHLIPGSRPCIDAFMGREEEMMIFDM